MGHSIGARLGFLGAGALLAVVIAILRGGSDPEHVSTAAPVAFWIADRDGCAVYGLDEDLVLARRVRVDWPTAVVGRPDGGAWVLQSSSGTPSGPARLVRLDPNGAIRSETVFSASASLDSLDDGTAIVLDGGDRVVLCDETGRIEIVYRGRALTCIAGSKDSVAVGDAQGSLVRVSLDPLGTVLARADLRERIQDLECDPNAGRFWALTSSERTTIHRLDDDFVVRSSAGVGSSTTSLAGDPDRERIWLLDGSVIRRLDDHGVVEFEIAGQPIVEPKRAVHDPRGGLVVASPGSVLLLDSTGRTRLGQGGFTHLVDVDRVP